jgi:hypothetical protein
MHVMDCIAVALEDSGLPALASDRVFCQMSAWLLVGADPLLRHAVGIGIRNIPGSRGYILIPSEPLDVRGIRQGEGTQDQASRVKCWTLFHLTYLFVPNA